jgi:hypothetical protein
MKKLFGILLVGILASGSIAQAHGGGGGGSSHSGGGSGYGGWGGHGGGYHGAYGGWHGGWYGGWGLGWWGGCYGYPYYYYDSAVSYAPPAGTVITTIPSASQPVVVDGVTYYTINGVTYYQSTSGLCPMAQPPQVIVNNNAAPASPSQAAYVSGPAASAPVSTMVAPAQQPVAGNPAVNMPVTEGVAAVKVSDAYTINIPNAKGGYSAVTLKRSGNGFTGPQGEYYPEFPKVELLKVMYGK